MKSKGFLLFELLVSLILLLICAGFFFSTYVNYSTLIRRMDFRQVVVGLLRDTVEFGAADYVGDGCEYVYSYSSALGRYTSQCVTCGPTLKECALSTDVDCCTNPFTKLGDIKSKKMTDLHLSAADANSVVIRYRTTTTNIMPNGDVNTKQECFMDLTFGGEICKTVPFNYTVVHVQGRWTQDGSTLNESLSLVPMGLVVSPTITVNNATEFSED